MTRIEGGVTVRKGSGASGVAAGIKPGTTKKDCALIVSDVAGGASVAEAAFHDERFTKRRRSSGMSPCVARNGSSHFCEHGQRERRDREIGATKTARATAEKVAQGLGVEPNKSAY